VKAPDCCSLGITNAFIQSEKIDELLGRLSKAPYLDNDTVSNIIEGVSDKPDSGPLIEKLDEINEIYALANVVEILMALKKNGSEWALKQYDTLMLKSPMSLCVTYHQLRKGAFQTFDNNMVMEYKMVNRIMKGYDFYEGVRALLIDKDNKPHWSPPSLDLVTQDATQAHFATMEELDLTIDKEDHNFIDD
jgi:enoyl-CoA hydratase